MLAVKLQADTPETGCLQPLRTTILHRLQVWADAAKRLALKALPDNRIFASFVDNLLVFDQSLPVPSDGGMSALAPIQGYDVS